jgi:hypothetical protein
MNHRAMVFVCMRLDTVFVEINLTLSDGRVVF